MQLPYIELGKGLEALHISLIEGMERSTTKQYKKTPGVFTGRGNKSLEGRTISYYYTKPQSLAKNEREKWNPDTCSPSSSSIKQNVKRT